MSVVVSISITLNAQQSLPTGEILPAGWRDLPPTELVSLVDSLEADNRFVVDLVRGDLASQAATLLQTRQAEIIASPTLLQSLVRLAGKSLPPDTQASLQVALVRDRQVNGDSDFIALSALVEQLKEVGASAHERASHVVKWLVGRDVTSLPTDQLAWLIDNVAAPRLSIQEFQVTWTGYITAPATSEYVFGISPTDPNHRATVEWRWGRIHSQLASMRVTIAGTAAIDAAEGHWQRESTPIPMQAGGTLPIKVEYTYKSDGYVPLSRAPVAQLFWTGGAVVRQIVPSSALSQGNGTSGGLDAQYRSTLPSGEQASVNRVDATIDLLVSAGQVLSPENSDQLQALSHELVQRAVSPTALDQFAATGISDSAAVILEATRSMELLSSAERYALAETLASRPEIVAQLPVWGAPYAYCMLRHNNPSASVEMVSSWMRQHPLGEVYFARKREDDYAEYRQVLRSLAHSLAREYPAHLAQFREQCLELSTGGCSIPAAMTVAYAELGEGRIEGWVSFLDAKLNRAVSGDARAQWLIARAHAEEIRRCPADHHIRGVERIFAGWPWLQEAQQVATTGSVRVYVAKEIASRMAVNEEFDTAKTFLDTVKATESPEALVSLGQAKADLERFREEIAALYVARESEAHAMQVAHFTKRLQHAKAAGSRRTAHYERMLGLLKQQSQ